MQLRLIEARFSDINNDNVTVMIPSQRTVEKTVQTRRQHRVKTDAMASIVCGHMEKWQ